MFICTTCQKAIKPQNNLVESFLPFCSKQCQIIDLGNWLTDRYTIPGPPADPIEIPPDLSDLGDSNE